MTGTVSEPRAGRRVTTPANIVTNMGNVNYAIVEAPSGLGLTSRGVDQLPAALLDSGLAGAIEARHAGRVDGIRAEASRDPATGVLNGAALRQYTYRLAEKTGEVLARGDTPVVLGGDCSILLGNLLALRRRGRYGLLFIDGHADFYQPDAEPNGEAASMDLALATGRGPQMLTQFDGYQRLVSDRDVVQFGRRDAPEAAAAGSQRIEDTAITVIDLAAIQARGVEVAIRHALKELGLGSAQGFWVHVDCDVLDDAIMPAVDYRLPGGLTWGELEQAVGVAMGSGRAAGIEITIFNPTLDPDGSVASALVSSLSRALRTAAKTAG